MISASHASAASVIVVLGLALACGGSETERPPAQTTVTSAPVVLQPGESARIGQLETQRDALKQQLADAQNLAATARDANERELRTLTSHDDFEDGTWDRLDRLDERIAALHAAAARSTPARHAKIDAVLRQVAQKRSGIEKDMHGAHRVSAADWPAFTRDIDLALGVIDADLASIEAH